MVRCVAALLAILGAANAAAAQQGSVQISSSTQVVTGSAERRAGQEPFEPDLGFTLYQPAFRFGNLFVDIHAVQRDNGARLGTAALGLRELKFGGLTWSITGGDSAVTPSLSTYAFTNLFAPQVTFAGGNLSGHSPRASVTMTAGRVTALRNIFGSDPQTVGQDMGQFQAKVRPWNRVEVIAHASRVRTHDARGFTTFVDSGSDAAGGVRVRPIPTLELTADAGVSRYQRRGSALWEQSVNALVGGKWTLRRGWLEVNAQRFSPGYFAVINTPYLDHEGAFAGGEIEAAPALRLFGGVEAFRTNLDPGASSAAAALPRGVTERAFAGARLHVGGPNFLTLRAEQGGRTAKPVGRPGSAYDSDTGITTVEFQTSARELSAFARYERRENLDRANGSGTYTQQTASAQLFGRLAQGVQLFGSAMLIQQARETGGQTFWQGGGGLQVQLPHRQLWLRGEGLFSRTDEWGADLAMPHELYTLGLSGQLTPQTAIAFDVMLDRAPQMNGRSSPWLGRSMLRLTHTVPTGSARVSSSAGLSGRRRGGASIFGVVFADWNGDGVQNTGEEPLTGVPFLYAEGSAVSVTPAVVARGVEVSSGKDGQFAFVNVPEGRARVSLDLAALPVDFDPPEQAWMDTETRGKASARLAFGLVPLGSIAGSVLQDANNDATSGPTDTPVDGAVLVLDDGARSEQTREGSFRFDAVRAGAHSVRVLPESLPEGMSMTGAAQLDLVLDRTQLHRDVTFLVKLEKRPEIRKVFPPKVAAKARTPASGAAPRAATVTAPRSRATAPTASAATNATAWYALQLAATHDRAGAWDLVRALQARGVDAYLSEDVDGLAKVRVGSYRTREEARRIVAKVQALHVGGAWIARTP